jgi:predicted ArsR family transcriptional regulator
MKTSRQRILEYVQSHYPLTAADLSLALRMTEANARHHLAILQDRGLVQPAGQRLPEGKGRPSRLFMPSEKTLGHSLDQLATALLEMVKDQGDPLNLDRAMHALAERIAQPGQGSVTIQGKSSQSLTQRLTHAVQLLNQLHYRARWEAWRGAPRLILGHCPYAAIIQQHPELCQMDSHLLEALTQAPARQTSKLTPDSKGTLHCIFHIEEGRKQRLT